MIVFQTLPIVGGNVLIIEGIQSQNYVGGFSGWRIAADGTAEFQNPFIRGIGSFGSPFPGEPQAYIGANSLLFGDKALVGFSTGDTDESLDGFLQAARGDVYDVPPGVLAALGLATDQPIMLWTPPQYTAPAYEFMTDPAPTSGVLLAGRDNAEADESAAIIAGDRVTFITSQGSRDVQDPVSAALPLAANVAAFGGTYGQPTYYVDNFAKTCTVTCMVTRTVASAAIAVHAIGTLPVGARPPREFVFDCETDMGGVGERARRLNIATSGAISMIALPAAVWGVGQFSGFTVTFPIV